MPFTRKEKNNFADIADSVDSCSVDVLLSMPTKVNIDKSAVLSTKMNGSDDLFFATKKDNKINYYLMMDERRITKRVIYAGYHELN